MTSRPSARFALRAAIAAALLIGSNAHADVTVQGPWVRATVPQQQATGAFMTLTSSTDGRLVSASSPLTPAVEIHEMAMDGDVMRMREVPGIALTAGKPVELKPGGYHLMLLNLKQQVKEGDVVPLTLVVEGSGGKRETIEVQAPVRALTTPSTAGGHGDHGGHGASATGAASADAASSGHQKH